MADELVRAVLLLRPREGRSFSAAVAAMTAQDPHDRRYLSHEELEARYGASPQDVEKVASFAAQNGLEVAEINREGRLVVLAGTGKQFAAAFRCELERVQVGQLLYRRPRQAFGISAELEEIVEGVFGLDNLPRFTRVDRSRHAVPAKGDSSTPDASLKAGKRSVPPSHPAEIMHRYRFPEEPKGKGQTIAILLLGGGFYEEDIRQFFGARMPRLEVVEVGGAKNDPAPRPAIRKYFDELKAGQAPSGDAELISQIWWTLEATVDIELAGSFAPGADLVVYFAPNEERGKIEGVTRVLTDRKHDPSVLSCSWGISEAEVDAAYVEALDRIFQLAALRGISVCYSSGDKGGDPQDGRPTVDYPASSPHVLSCGGTTLLPRSLGKPESAWYEPMGSVVLATGGGFSRFFPRPDWQRGVPASPDGKARRGVPDVAGKADYTSGYDLLLAGRQTLGGGTSSAAPMWAGLLARFNQALGARIGWITPLLYRPQLAQSLNDIVVGHNGVYKAVPGWDATTGWGTPDGEALLRALLLKKG
ncbi:MAG: S8/S53 family peptidase [bacterium]|nr:S8/S53 family peptidase [bacterium]